eukprot:PhM_4_TR841/c0_g1_i1/m.1966
MLPLRFHVLRQCNITLPVMLKKSLEVFDEFHLHGADLAAAREEVFALHSKRLDVLTELGVLNLIHTHRRALHKCLQPVPLHQRGVHTAHGLVLFLHGALHLRRLLVQRHGVLFHQMFHLRSDALEFMDATLVGGLQVLLQSPYRLHRRGVPQPGFFGLFRKRFNLLAQRVGVLLGILPHAGDLRLEQHDLVPKLFNLAALRFKLLRDLEHLRAVALFFLDERLLVRGNLVPSLAERREEVAPGGRTAIIVVRAQDTCVHRRVCNMDRIFLLLLLFVAVAVAVVLAADNRYYRIRDLARRGALACSG